MKTLFLVLFTSLLTFGQDTLLWNVVDTTLSNYYSSPKYCDTAESYEEALTQWTYNGNWIIVYNQVHNF